MRFLFVCLFFRSLCNPVSFSFIVVKFTILTILNVEFSGINTFMLLCSNHDHPSLELFHLPNLKLYALCLPSACGNHHSTLCTYEFD